MYIYIYIYIYTYAYCENENAKNTFFIKHSSIQYGGIEKFLDKKLSDFFDQNI